MTTEREKVLHDGAALTSGDRDKTYGPPSRNLELQMVLYAAYAEVAKGKHSAGHDAAMQHVFAKVARIAAGNLHRDNYVDGATYLAIAWECENEAAHVAAPGVNANVSQGAQRWKPETQ